MTDRAREMPLTKWKVWIFKAGEDFELPRGCDGVRRPLEQEPEFWEYIVCCPQAISFRQADRVFQGVKALRHAVGQILQWRLTKPQLLEMDFEECERHPGVFDPPVIPPGRPRYSKLKVKVSGCRLKYIEFDSS